jgi:predicted transcriptional regulator
MPKYRGSLEIIADILDAVGDGAKKTRIMYFANLSYKLLGKYLKKTMDAGLVSSDEDHYEVTEKGHTFLERFKDFSGRYSKINKHLEEILFERDVLRQMCDLGGSGGGYPKERRLKR